MNCRSLLVAGLLLFPAAASAQDVDWSGFYIGVELGGAGSDLEAASTDNVVQVTNINPAGAQPITIVPGTTVGLNQSESETNAIYGGIIGFQMQRGQWVFGLEAGLEGPREAGSVAQNNTIPPTLLSPASTVLQQRNAEFEYAWSARIRIGLSLGQTLVYAAGGAAGARVDVEAVNTYAIPAGNSGANPPVAGPAIGPNVTIASANRSMIGWTAGAGGEQRLGRHVSFGLDLRFSDYGDKTVTFDNVAITRSGATTFPGAEGGTGSLVPPANDPRSDPGPTRISINEWRLAARLIFRF